MKIWSNMGLQRFSGLYLWALFIVIFSLWAPQTFPTLMTLQILASTQSIAALAAIALLIPMVAGQYDLSVGAAANLSGIVAIVVQVNGWMSAIPAIILGVLVGALVGFANGFVVVKLKVNSFIATIGTSSILIATILIVTGGIDPPPPQSEQFTAFTQTTVFGFQLVLYYLIVIAILAWWLLERTPAGRYLYASGANPEAARLTGVNVDRWAWLTLVLSGTIAGFAGVLFVSVSGPSIHFGEGLLLPAFAAVFLGATQLKPGKFNVWGTLVAILVLATGVQGLQLVYGSQWIASMFNGVAVITAVALAVRRQRSVTTR